MTAPPLLTVENLKTQFFTPQGTVRAVDGVSFTVRKGEIVGLVGESGAGKSVAVRSILRLIDDPGEIVGGEITYRDTTIVGFEEHTDGLVPRDEMLSESAMRREIRGSEIAIIFQDPMESLNPVYTVGDQLREFIELNRDLDGEAARTEAVRMLREVGIPEPERRYDDYPHEFSGGMRQRVLIAMALGCRPDLIIADEPTTALDVSVEGQILELVDELQSEYGTSFVWVTHDMGVVAEICDRVNVMYLGQIVEQGTIDEIFYDTQHPYTQSLLDSIPRPDRAIEELSPIRGVMPEPIDPPTGCRFHTRCPDAKSICRDVDPQLVDVGDDDPESRGSVPPHRAACLKHESIGYETSQPIDEAYRANGVDQPAGPTGDDDSDSDFATDRFAGENR